MHGTAGIPQDPEQSASSLHVSYHDGIWNFLSSEPAFLAPPYLSACRLIAPAVRFIQRLKLVDKIINFIIIRGESGFVKG